MKLVVAEKPSVARDIARVLKCSTRREGYFEGSGCVVTWALGHLVEIAEPEAMNPAWGKPWSAAQLPMLPEAWSYAVRRETRQQFEVIRRLMKDPSCEQIVCATDAGREGEHIFRLIYEHAGARRPWLRLWISSLTEQAIRDGFRTLKPSSAFDDLAAAARSRAHADWLVGLNFTRAYSVHNRGALYTIGRVQTPTLAMVVARQREIQTFVPVTYYELHADLEPGFKAKYLGEDRKTSIPDKARAEKLRAELDPVPTATVQSVRQQDKRIPPPALFDLATLQREANRRFGYTAAETLAIAQRLYEVHKLLTYPRTESRHLSRDLLPQLPGILRALPAELQSTSEEALKRLEAGHTLGKAYVDDARLTDHHAIIPTAQPFPPGGSLQALAPQERSIYELVARRFACIFLPEAVRAETVVLLDLGGHSFRAAGSVVKQRGWMRAAAPEPERGEGEQMPDTERQALPPLEVGQVVAKRGLELVERQTQPPRPYNDGSLLTAMERAGERIEDEELAERMKGSGLGTAATRHAIIERLIKTGYLERERKTLVATPKGVALVGQVVPDLKDPALTGRWEQQLKDIEEGRASADAFDRAIARYVAELLPKVAASPAIASPPAGPAPGTAPAVRRGRRTSSTPPAAGTGRETPNPALSGKELPCPACGKGVIRKTPKAWGCSRWREGCAFTIWAKVAGKALTDRQVETLLVWGKTGPLKGFKSKAGKSFTASLALDKQDFKVKLVF